MHLTIGLIVGMLLFIPILLGISYALTMLCGIITLIGEGFGGKFHGISRECEEPNVELIAKRYYYPYKLRIIITKDNRLYVCDSKGCSELMWLFEGNFSNYPLF